MSMSTQTDNKGSVFCLYMPHDFPIHGCMQGYNPGGFFMDVESVHVSCSHGFPMDVCN